MGMVGVEGIATVAPAPAPCQRHSDATPTVTDKGADRPPHPAPRTMLAVQISPTFGSLISRFKKKKESECDPLCQHLLISANNEVYCRH